MCPRCCWMDSMIRSPPSPWSGATTSCRTSGRWWHRTGQALSSKATIFHLVSIRFAKHQQSQVAKVLLDGLYDGNSNLAQLRTRQHVMKKVDLTSWLFPLLLLLFLPWLIFKVWEKVTDNWQSFLAEPVQGEKQVGFDRFLKHQPTFHQNPISGEPYTNIVWIYHNIIYLCGINFLFVCIGALCWGWSIISSGQVGLLDGSRIFLFYIWHSVVRKHIFLDGIDAWVEFISNSHRSPLNHEENQPVAGEAR